MPMNFTTELNLQFILLTHIYSVPFRHCGLPRWLSSKEYACQCKRPKFDPGSERSPGEGNGNPLQYSCLGNSMDRGAWWATVECYTEKNMKRGKITEVGKDRKEKSTYGWFMFLQKIYKHKIYGISLNYLYNREHQRIDAFELWCWRTHLRVPWTAKRSNQSIQKEISPEYSVGRLMLKLRLNTLATWHEKLTNWKRPWCWERLKAGGEGDDRAWDGWMALPTWWA